MQPQAQSLVNSYLSINIKFPVRPLNIMAAAVSFFSVFAFSSINHLPNLETIRHGLFY